VPEHPGVADVEIRLSQGGRVAGRVTDRVSGQPISGARISLEGESVGALSVLDAGTAAFSGPDGSFLLGGLPSRTSSIQVSADGHHARIVGGIDVRDGAVSGPVEVRLSPVAEGEDPRVELAGIGASLERRGRSVLRINGVVPGGGAAEAGLAPGDEVLAVEGRPISELGFGGAIDLIRGPEDTRVRLIVRRGDGPSAEIWVWRRIVRG
jgi:membrane-associated protease RseP (regulator of RpoE activity)